MSARHGEGAVAYSFVSRWRVPAAPERCWREVERMLRPGAPSWWPGMRVVAAPAHLRPGETVVVAVRTPFGYSLRMRLELTDVVPAVRLAARSEGDLDGEGVAALEPDGSAASVVTLHWNVMTRKAWMNRTALVLRPLFLAGHALVMRAGLRGLRRALRG